MVDSPTCSPTLCRCWVVVNPVWNIPDKQNKDNQLGVCYLGSGKVLMINAHDAANMVKVKDDWWYASMWEYLVVDVNTQQVIRKLNFPPLLNSRSAVVHDGKVYIAVNNATADAIYVWGKWKGAATIRLSCIN